MNPLIGELYKSYYGKSHINAKLLAGAGSNRKYYRLTGNDGTSAIAVEGTNIEENRAFLSIGNHLHLAGANVPEIFATSMDSTCYLQQDLGDTSLYDLLQDGRIKDGFTPQVTGLIEETVSALADLQYKAGKDMDYSVCFPCQSFDRRSVFWDLYYFKYCFLKGSGLEFNETLLEDDFEKFSDMLLAEAPYSTFMYRDFQARNVMIFDSKPWFIDFQGGRRGPIEYDLASFLWQARAAYQDSFRDHLIDIYLNSLKRYRAVDRKYFVKQLKLFALFRNLQTLGAYGYRGYFEHKPQFLQSVPAAMDNLKKLTPVISDKCKYLSQILGQLSSLPQYNDIQTFENDGRLTVRITSFSFRKGIPEDLSGNGGGFVFDCRSMHNPGLYQEYKSLTGNDQPVIDFLESEGEIQIFLNSVAGLVNPAVDKYLERGFTSLMVSFGCTGGQHRSVYCAHHLATELKRKYGEKIRILLEHREQNSRTIL